MPAPQINIIGELMNNAYARARTAWEKRDVAGYQHLARLQAAKGAVILNVNVDGTQRLSVTMEEMLAFLPHLVPALQAATDTALSFDNPNLDYQHTAMAHYDRAKSRGKPVYNSLAASRQRLPEMIAFIKEHDMRCIVMASERFGAGGASEMTFKPEEAHETVRIFADLLVSQGGRSLDDIIVDPGLAPVAADMYGLINLGLDTMRLCCAKAKINALPWDTLCKALILCNLTDVDLLASLQALLLAHRAATQEQASEVVRHLPSYRHTQEQYTDTFAAILHESRCQTRSHVALQSLREHDLRREMLREQAARVGQGFQKPSLTAFLEAKRLREGSALASQDSLAAFCGASKISANASSRLKQVAYYLACLPDHPTSRRSWPGPWGGTSSCRPASRPQSLSSQTSRPCAP